MDIDTDGTPIYAVDQILAHRDRIRYRKRQNRRRKIINREYLIRWAPPLTHENDMGTRIKPQP